jgi:hypothetical protein
MMSCEQSRDVCTSTAVIMATSHKLLIVRGNAAILIPRCGPGRVPCFLGEDFTVMNILDPSL